MMFMGLDCALTVCCFAMQRHNKMTLPRNRNTESISFHLNSSPNLCAIYVSMILCGKKKCFNRELALKGIEYKSQISVPIVYKGIKLDAELRFDVMIEDSLIVELKAIDGLLPVHDAILLTYMKLLQIPKGILINFNCTNIFKNGQRTLVNELYSGLAVH